MSEAQIVTSDQEKTGGEMTKEKPIIINYANEIGPLRMAAMQQGYASLTGEFVCNYLLSRAGLAGAMGHEDSKRDMDRECNYPTDPDAEFYTRLYRRGDVAVRVNDMWPDMTWEDAPQILEKEGNTAADATPFEAGFEQVALEHALYSKFLMVDRVSGLGQYGCLFFGLPGPADQPSAAWDNAARNWTTEFPSNTPLAYVKAFGEAQCKIMAYETDPGHKRYGLPVVYQLTLANLTQVNNGSTAPPMGTIMVHCSRVVHVCEGFLGSETHGAPRLESVLNRLLDIRKIAGGSGEMFWKGGFPGIAFEVDPKNTEVELDRDALRAEMNAFSDGLQRYLALVGVKASSLKVQVADPTAHTEMNLKLIAIAKNIPYRTFAGTEEGKLAGTQDQKATEKRVGKRREQYATPIIVRPTVELLVRSGVIPPPEKNVGQLKKRTPAPVLAAEQAAEPPTPVGLGYTGLTGLEPKRDNAYTPLGPTGTPNNPLTVTAPIQPQGINAPTAVRFEPALGATQGLVPAVDQSRDQKPETKDQTKTGETGGAAPKGAEVPTSRTRLEFSVVWPPSGRPSEQEAADILLKVAQALDYYSKGNASLIMHPMDFLVDIVGLTQERATQILDRVAKGADGDDTDAAIVAAQLARLEAEAKALESQAAASEASPLSSSSAPPKADSKSAPVSRPAELSGDKAKKSQKPKEKA